MSAILIVTAVLSVVSLTALAISIFAVFQSRLGLREATQRGPSIATARNAELQEMRSAIDSLAAQIREVQTAAPAGPPIYKGGPSLNLTKRSQALRMHRRGEPPAQIAAALELPHQEVDLLIKVQRIVLGKL